MNLYTILENTTSREDLIPEHGLSLYVETGPRKLLFDTGQSGRFWDNAARLGLDLTRVDTVVLSHGHYDHGGGLGRFLECNKKARIFVSSQAFGGYYHGPEKYIGLSPALRDNPRLTAVDRPRDLGDGLSLIPGTAVPIATPSTATASRSAPGDGWSPTTSSMSSICCWRKGESASSSAAAPTGGFSTSPTISGRMCSSEASTL